MLRLRRWSLKARKMNSGGYTIEVTCLSPKATEKHQYDFLLSVVQLSMLKLPEFDMKVIVQDRSGDYACTAYVTFKDAHSQENCLFAQHKEDTASSSLAQEVVKTMLAKGYVLSKDALAEAKYFDDSHQVSATATEGRSVAAAANTMVNSSYFSKGAMWVSGALNQVAKVAADLGSGAKQ
ncbi:Binding partner of ACD11 1 [Glycine max]|nr:Binding partner of ACD11 1 [Glycine max]